MSTLLPGTLPLLKAPGVVVPPVTTGVELVAAGAVMVTTWFKLTAL